jgi:hypothetical protein
VRSGQGDLEASVEERGSDLSEARAGLAEAGLGRSVTEGEDMVEDFGRQVGHRQDSVGRRRKRRKKVRPERTPVSRLRLPCSQTARPEPVHVFIVAFRRSLGRGRHIYQSLPRSVRQLQQKGEVT